MKALAEAPKLLEPSSPGTTPRGWWGREHLALDVRDADHPRRAAPEPVVEKLLHARSARVSDRQCNAPDSGSAEELVVRERAA